MDIALADLMQQPSAVLLAGSALLAGGLSLVLGVTLYWIRARRRAVVRREERSATAIDVVDEVIVPVTAPAPKVDLGAIDSRLEEVETQLERLHTRIDALVRQRETKVAVRSASSPSAGGSKGSDEERALREMVARNR